MKSKTKGLFVAKGFPCKAYDVKTKTLIGVYTNASEAGDKFYMSPRKAVNVITSIRNRGATKIDGDWIAFRNATEKELKQWQEQISYGTK